MSFYIGLMSGTSMDGVDAAIVNTSTNSLIHGITVKYNDSVRKQLDNFLADNIQVSTLCHLNHLIGVEFANAVLKLLEQAKIDIRLIEAIGSHGQTVAHNMQSEIPYTLQLGCAHTISTLTKCTVVADFRTRDVVLGGQGAPFAPLYHHELFTQRNETIALINLGGISNISIIEPQKSVVGWDMGPANCLMDAWINKNQFKAFDYLGKWAESGNCIPELLMVLGEDPFITRNYPKSIGKEYFSLKWLEQYLKPEYTAADVQKTLLLFTVNTIAETITNIDSKLTNIYLCGGGCHNLALTRHLSKLLPNHSISTTAELGVDPDYLEAMIFAWLAQKTICRQRVDLRTITGASDKAILGAIYPYFGSLS